MEGRNVGKRSRIDAK